PQGFWPTMNGGPAALYCFIWLYFSAAGAGPWSLDSRRGSRRGFAWSQQPRSRKGDSMLKVGIITGSTRPNRKSLDVAKWVLEAARKRSDAEYELVDIKDFDLPLLDEPMPP